MSRVTRSLAPLWSALFGVVCLLLLGMAWLSRRWPIEHDAPILLYIAFLIDHYDRIPYRDIFGINLPAVYYLNVAWGRWFGAYSTSGFRLVDLAHLAGILAGSILWMRPFGLRIAVGGASLFGLWYLAQGTRMSLQREYYMLLPVLWALVLLNSRLRPGLRGFLLGLLFGLAANIKPTVLIALPWTLAWMLRGEQKSSRRSTLLLSAGGVAVPMAVTFLYLRLSGSWPAFASLAVDYWPLYGALTKHHELLAGGRALYLLRESFHFGGQALWLIPALLGAWIGWRATREEPERRRQLLLLFGLLLSFLVYAPLSGKFWRYHWLPFMYFAFQLVALAAARVDSRALALAGLVAFVSVAAAEFRPPSIVLSQLHGEPIERLRGDRVEKLSAYLRNNVQPGQTVQPLDWAGGAIDAMLEARVPLATSFVYDFHFYHHVNKPYIQQLRRRFLEELEASRPDFIIEVRTRRPRPRGPRTAHQFPELRQFLRGYLSMEMVAEGVVVYRN